MLYTDNACLEPSSQIAPVDGTNKRQTIVEGYDAGYVGAMKWRYLLSKET